MPSTLPLARRAHQVLSSVTHFACMTRDKHSMCALQENAGELCSCVAWHPNKAHETTLIITSIGICTSIRPES